MFLNILRILASIVLKMFLNLAVSIGCPVVQTNRKHKYTLSVEIVATLDGKKEI